MNPKEKPTKEIVVLRELTAYLDLSYRELTHFTRPCKEMRQMKKLLEKAKRLLKMGSVQ